MATQDNKGPIIVIGVVAAIIVLGSVLAIMLFNGLASHEPRTLGYDNTRPPDEAFRPDAEQVEKRRQEQDAARDDAKVNEEPEEFNEEEFWDKARQAAIDYNDGKEPTHCETPCDCPQGWDCQLGSQLCLRGPFPVYCCEKDECPSGEMCRTEDGGYGVCEGDKE